MANVKISELSLASTPLTGTESVPMVQSGVTVKASVQDIVDLAGVGGTSNYGNAQILDVTGSPSATYDLSVLFPTVTFTNRAISMQMQIVISSGANQPNYGSIFYNVIRNNASSPFWSYGSPYSSQTSGSVFPSFIFSGTEAAPTLQFYVSSGQTYSIHMTIITVI